MREAQRLIVGRASAVVSLLVLGFGTVAGSSFWLRSYLDGQAATAGQVMIAALPILSGLQLILSALNFDMRNVPTIVRHQQFVRQPG